MDNQAQGSRIAIFLATFLVVAGCWFVVKELFVHINYPIKSAIVSGQFEYLDREAVKSVVFPHLNKGILSIDLVELEKELKSLAWVKSVAVRRQWPEKLEIFLSEQVPVAFWQHDGLMTADGLIFKPRQIPQDLILVRFDGAEAQTQTLQNTYQLLEQQLAAAEFSIISLKMDDRGNVFARLAHEKLGRPMTLVLGREELDAHISRFLQALENDLRFFADVVWVDTRYLNGVAIKRTAIDSLSQQVAKQQ